MAKQVTVWTREQKQQAAMLFAVNGVMSKVSQETTIPETTLSTWKREDSEWLELVTEVRSVKADEHRAMYSQLVSEAQAKALELLPTTKCAKTAMLVACMGTDKVRLHDGLATSITGKAESMDSLAQEFKKLSAKWDEKQVKVVSTQEDTQVIDK